MGNDSSLPTATSGSRPSVPPRRGDPRYGRFRQVALLTGIPLALVVGPVCGYFFGHFLDQRFATDPWFMVLFVVIGAISGVREMILLMKKAAKDG